MTCGCEPLPTKAVAGRPEPSLAGVVVTRGRFWHARDSFGDWGPDTPFLGTLGASGRPKWRPAALVASFVHRQVA